VAELSTASGSRAPLAHVADQVFRDLTLAIEAQGVRQKVAADMFGMALRSYQKKVFRVRASATLKNRTLWEVVVGFIGDNAPVTRKAILERLRYDDERDVAAVLLDLNESGLITASGKGEHTVYRLSEAHDLPQMDESVRLAAACDQVWLSVARNPKITFANLAGSLPYDEELLKKALSQLLGEQRISCEGEGEAATYDSDRCLLPVGAEHGWETAVFDHFQAVTLAIASKVRRGQRKAATDDEVGGGTLCFDLSADHPLRGEAEALFQELRRKVTDLWDRVEAYNDEKPIQSEELQRLWFYYGQRRQLAENDETP
jgi:hypothetical protein